MVALPCPTPYLFGAWAATFESELTVEPDGPTIELKGPYRFAIGSRDSVGSTLVLIVHTTTNAHEYRHETSSSSSISRSISEGIPPVAVLRS
jgi:hypothetical protein